MTIINDKLYEQWWHNPVIEKLKLSIPNREIARDVFGNSSFESRIRRFLERDDVVKEVGNPKPVDKNLLRTPAKVGFVDIECTYNYGGHFQNYGQNIHLDQKLRDSHLLSYAYAWNNDKPVGEVLKADVIQQDFIRSIVERDPFTKIDYDLTLKLWYFLDNADVVVAQNGKAFDIKKINGYFLKYDLPLPSPYKVYDTLSVAKKMFNISFKSLKFLAKYLGVTQKLDNSGAELWMDCSTGYSDEALQTMLEYNIGDIITLREVYLKMIKYGNDNVNMALYEACTEASCPTCGSTDVKPLNKTTNTQKRVYEVYRCGHCSSLMRDNIAVNETNKFSVIV